MPIQEPITALTNLFLLVFSLYAFCSLIPNVKHNWPSTLFYLFFFLFTAGMSFFGALFHTNNVAFYDLQKYGTMITGGFLSASLALAGIFDNFNKKVAILWSLLPICLTIIYFATIPLNSFLPFIILQFTNIILVVFAYSRTAPNRKTSLIYAACGIFLAAGTIQTQGTQLFFLNHNDIFHLLSLLALAIIFKAI